MTMSPRNDDGDDEYRWTARSIRRDFNDEWEPTFPPRGVLPSGYLGAAGCVVYSDSRKYREWILSDTFADESDMYYDDFDKFDRTRFGSGTPADAGDDE